MDETVLAAVGLAAIDDPEFTTKLINHPEDIADSLGVSRTEVQKLARIGADGFEAVMGGLIVHRLLPFDIGERLLVVPSTFAQPIETSRKIIRLDQSREGAWIDATGVSRIAGRVFGSGAHPTTLLCLTALESNLRPGDRVLDLGTGSGILAIAAVALGAVSVDACDVDSVAVEVARENAIANGCLDRINLSQDDFDSLSRKVEPATYDLIVTNILGPIHVANLESGLADLLRPDGPIILSGFGDHHVEEVGQALEAHGVAVERVEQRDPWMVMIGRKR